MNKAKIECSQITNIIIHSNFWINKIVSKKFNNKVSNNNNKVSNKYNNKVSNKTKNKIPKFKIAGNHSIFIVKIRFNNKDRMMMFMLKTN